MSINQAFPPINRQLVNSNPTLYAASLAGNPTPEEALITKNLIGLDSLHTKLNTAKNLDEARKEFWNLDPTIRTGLIFMNPESDYMQKSPSILSRVGHGVLNFVSSPFRDIQEKTEEYTQALSMVYKTIRNVGDTGKSGKEKLDYILNRQNWTDAFDGKNQWDEVAREKLDAKHGAAMSALARGLIDGKTPGEIIKEYGDISNDNGAMVNAIRDFSDQNQKYKDAFAEYKAYQINPGNDFTNWANSNHPPKDGGIWGAIIPMLIAAPTLGVGGVGVSKDGERWLAENPNPFSKDPYVSPSGQINAAYVVAIDPLTWLTGGSSRALLASEKLAENFTKAAQRGVPVDVRIADLFADTRVAAKHEALAPVINAYRDAIAAKDPVQAGVVRTHIQTYFPEYNEETLLRRMVDVKVLNDAEQLVPVTNLDTMKKFFEIGENTNYILSGKMESIQYYRESHVMLERFTRKTTDGMKAMYDQMFNGLDRRVIAGEAPIPDEVYESAKAFENYFGNTLDFKLIDRKNDPTLKELGIAGKRFSKSYNDKFARQAGRVMLFAQDGLAYKSASAFRDFSRMIVGDKLTANWLTEMYLMKSPDDRFNMLASMLKLYSDKIGLSSVPKGVELQRAWLEGIFASTRGAGPLEQIVMPPHLANEAAIEIAPGASQILHTTEGIAMPNFEELSKWLYQVNGLNRRLMRYIGINGVTNNAFTAGIMRGWTAFQLLPDLGVKASVDEATMALMVQQPQAIYSFFNGKGSAMSKMRAAYRGSDETMGMVKSKMLSMLGKNPAEYISAAERRAMQEPLKFDASYTLPNGKIIDSYYVVSPDEFYGASFEERLAARVIAKYAGKLSPEEERWMATHLINNSHSMEGQVQSSVAATFGDTTVRGSLMSEMYGKSTLTEAADAMGRKDTGKYLTDEMNLLRDSDKAFIQFDSFYKYFGKNTYTTNFKTTVDFGDAFIRNNALRTTEDGEKFVVEVMEQLGWTRLPNKTWSAQGKKIGDTIVSKENIRKSIQTFNERFRQSSKLRDAGKTPAQISEGLVRNLQAELYSVFHGGPDKFNEALLNAIRNRMDEATTKLSKRKNAELSDMHLRNYAGKPLPKKSAKTEAERIKFEAQVASASYQVRKMPFNDFEILTANNRIEGKLRTSYDFPALVDSANAAYKKYGDMPWEMMDRQLTDFYRSDAFNIKLLQQRKVMQADEKNMVNSLVKEGADLESAKLQADLYFDNRATENATNELMKYADNPDIRTQLAWNARGVGRFYRATEDYARRMARYLYTHPDKVLYRLGHFSQAMNGSGVVYTDDNGTQYVLIPNDGVVWRIVAPTFAAIMNPLRAAENVAKGNWDFFKQPAWNQSTLKLSLLNPSYGEGAGVPSLTGPTMAIPTLTAKAILGLSDNPTLQNIGDNLDNWILGPQSDNTTWVRAIVPGNLLNIWGQYDPEHKTAIEASTLVQAAAFLQANDATRLKPEDYKDAEKVQLYYERLRLAAHNIVSVKLGFNTISAAPMGQTEPNIPSELRKVGIVKMSTAFSDILRAVLDVNSKYGYGLEDPIGAAVSMFVASNPDKLIYTVSPNTKQAQIAINYTQETKKWVMGNSELLKTYPDVAFVFAPHAGEYDPSVIKFLEASDLIKGKDNPFDINGAALKKYLMTLAAVKARNDYYNIDREVQRKLNDPENTERNRATYRQELLSRADAQKKYMLNENYALKTVLGTSSFETRALLTQRFNHLDQMVNNPKFIGVIAEGPRKKLIEQMLPLAKRVAMVLEDVNIRSQFDGQTVVDDTLRNGMANLQKYSSANPILAEAFNSVIKPYLDDLYTIPTVAMGK
jgi:hypothetical protein